MADSNIIRMQAVLARSMLLLSLTAMTAAAPSGLPVVEANDNRTTAGVLRNDTLTIHLVVKMAAW